jgi:glucose/mannose-6-phosphate isomerase
LLKNKPLKELIANFSQHLEEALKTIHSTKIKSSDRAVHNVLITGLGGSGIGGSVVAELVGAHSPVPITVNKNYDIPAFVNEFTLVIACSYSGNTEETLSAVAQAQAKGAMFACISSGGKLKEIAEKKSYNLLSMEGGNPPRSMFAYSIAFLLRYMEAYGLSTYNVIEELKASIQLLNTSETETLKEAEAFAENIKNTIPQVLANNGSLAVAARFRQQLNENSKMLSWEAEVPEMNHNELVGWEGGDNRFSAVFIRNSHDNPRNQKRMDIIKGIIGEKTEHVYEMWSKGESKIQKALYLVHFGDWVTYYLSEINQVDIMDIKSIDLLKAELSKIPL